MSHACDMLHAACDMVSPSVVGACQPGRSARAYDLAVMLLRDQGLIYWQVGEGMKNEE
jgi:hypothetical protein